MGKKTTVYEDRARKEAERRRREEEYRQKHTVACPACGKDILDHMTKCPSCGASVKPVGYQPMNAKKIALIRGISFVVLMAVAIVFMWFFVWNK